MIRRNTIQKQIVYDALNILGHASSDELIKYINSNYVNISLATIYRNLTILLEDGLVKKVNLDNALVYETTKENHYHFVCTKCKMIKDVFIDDFSYTLNTNDKVENINIELYGICENCLKNKKEKV